MTRLPPIPPEQRNFAGDKVRDRLRSAEPDRRDDDTAPPTQAGSDDLQQDIASTGAEQP